MARRPLYGEAERRKDERGDRSNEVRKATGEIDALLYGIDGCRGGWVVARSAADLSSVSIDIVSELRSIFEEARCDSILAIDIPIGIPENEPRMCDSAARKLLRWPRSSSVFSPPARQALHASTFTE